MITNGKDFIGPLWRSRLVLHPNMQHLRGLPCFVVFKSDTERLVQLRLFICHSKKHLGLISKPTNLQLLA